MNRSSTDTDAAFTQLLSLWQASYTPAKTDGCSQALAQGLRCLMQRGSLAQLMGRSIHPAPPLVETLTSGSFASAANAAAT